jgi:hypothetical protein
MHLFATLNFWKTDAVLSFLLNLRIAMLIFFPMVVSGNKKNYRDLKSHLIQKPILELGLLF